MKIATLNRALPALFIAMGLAACTQTAAPAAEPTSTQAPAATEAPATAVPPTAEPTTEPTAAPTATPAGQAFSFNGVEVTIPSAVASGAGGEVVPAAAAADLPEFGKNPEYTRINLLDYPAQNEHFQGMIQVLPVADYEQISEVATQRVEAMQTLLAEKPAAPEDIPVLPVLNAAQVFRTQVQYLDFQNGAGVRFVTMYSQALLPATNGEVFYTYQGLTADGAYWVSAILPVNAAFLAADMDSAINPPAGGVPFPDPATLSAEDAGAQVDAYYQAMTGKLDATSEGEFTPSLDALDAMMQSLRVTAP